MTDRSRGCESVKTMTDRWRGCESVNTVTERRRDGDFAIMWKKLFKKTHTPKKRSIVLSKGYQNKNHDVYNRRSMQNPFVIKRRSIMRFWLSVRFYVNRVFHLIVNLKFLVWDEYYRFKKFNHKIWNLRSICRTWFRILGESKQHLNII